MNTKIRRLALAAPLAAVIVGLGIEADQAAPLDANPAVVVAAADSTDAFDATTEVIQPVYQGAPRTVQVPEGVVAASSAGFVAFIGWAAYRRHRMFA